VSTGRRDRGAELRHATLRPMVTDIGRGALRPNPTLEPFQVLVGEWHTTGSHLYLPGITLHGRTVFAWLAGGAFVLMQSEIDDHNVPSGVVVLGSDDVAQQYFMLYFDERGTSRKYDVSMTGRQLTWWRDAPSFSQRFTLAIADDGNTMVGQGEMSRAGAAWEKDLALTYIRVQ
jgi:hypothetical protein